MQYFIYIIQNELDVKVGISKDPAVRLKQLQTGNSNILLLYKTYCVPKEKARKLEIKCHEALNKIYEKRGEWFKNVILWDIECIIEEIIEN